MIEDSPFATFGKVEKKVDPRVIHLMWCDNCHYAWKSGAVVKRCINCKHEVEEEVRVLTSYISDVPIT